MNSRVHCRRCLLPAVRIFNCINRKISMHISSSSYPISRFEFSFGTSVQEKIQPAELLLVKPLELKYSKLEGWFEFRFGRAWGGASFSCGRGSLLNFFWFPIFWNDFLCYPLSSFFKFNRRYHFSHSKKRFNTTTVTKLV